MECKFQILGDPMSCMASPSVAAFGTHRIDPVMAIPVSNGLGLTVLAGVVSSQTPSVRDGCWRCPELEMFHLGNGNAELCCKTGAHLLGEVCLPMPGSAYGSLQAMAGAGTPGPSAWAGHEATGMGRGSVCAPGTQSRGLAPWLAFAHGCRDGAALFFPPYVLLLSMLVALGL